MSELKVIQEQQKDQNIDINRDNYDHYNEENLNFKAQPGVSEELVRQISRDKNEPEWMLNKRLIGLRVFLEKPIPNWGPNLSELNLNNIIYFMKPNAKKNSSSWSDVPEDIRKTYERLGIPKAEREALGGVGAQYECLSEDTIIFTNSKGPIKIKDIKKGNEVFALDENENKIKRVKVLAVKNNGENQVYEVIVY